MALSGLDIYKLLPKTNCKECGYPTCLAFAMKLATKGAELSQCPHVTEASKQALDAASRPPIRLVTIGANGKKIEVGNETVLYRHDKTFLHQPGMVIRIRDTQPEAEVGALVERVAAYGVERVGATLALDGFAVQNASADAATFAKCVSAISDRSSWPLVLMSRDPAAMEAALKVSGRQRPLVHAATEDNVATMAGLAKQYNCPLVVTASDLAGLTSLVEQAGKAGVEDIVLDAGTRQLQASLASLTQLRRLALRKNFRPLGYPVITFPGEGAGSALEEAQAAAQDIAKYSGVIVLDHFDPSIAYPLLTLRQNVYTDPQKPIQVKPDVYAFGEATEKSPVLVTTNFSLTYFSVAGEVESSGVPTWLVITDSEGLSVLTAWAAGKFDAERIAKAVKSLGVAEKVSHRKLVIPGYVAGMSGEIEDELPGWQIMVGPRESVDIGPYLKTWTA